MDVISSIQTPDELLKYMRENIVYGFVGKNGKKYYDMFSEEWNDWYTQCFVQSGEEVLESKTGTCWDQVELERLWFERKGYTIHSFFMWFEVNKENNYPTHTFLIYENDNKYYWFENAFEAERGIYEFDSLDDAIECVKSKQINYVRNNFSNSSLEDMERLTVYEYSKPGNHLGVEEYFKHVTSIKYISE
jgi:hypothetical protein